MTSHGVSRLIDILAGAHPEICFTRLFFKFSYISALWLNWIAQALLVSAGLSDFLSETLRSSLQKWSQLLLCYNYLTGFPQVHDCCLGVCFSVLCVCLSVIMHIARCNCWYVLVPVFFFWICCLSLIICLADLSSLWISAGLSVFICFFSLSICLWFCIKYDTYWYIPTLMWFFLLFALDDVEDATVNKIA